MIRAELNQALLKGGQCLPFALLHKTMKAVDQALGIKEKRDLSIAFVDQKTMKQLNATYRGKQGITDVLSFAYANGPFLGEVVINYEQARKQAKEQGHSTRDEIMFLMVHGCLHLLGYDHEQKKDAQKMFSIQKRILESLDINPTV